MFIDHYLLSYIVLWKSHLMTLVNLVVGVIYWPLTVELHSIVEKTFNDPSQLGGCLLATVC